MFLVHIHCSKHPCLQVASGLRATVIKFTYEASLVSLPEKYNNNSEEIVLFIFGYFSCMPSAESERSCVFPRGNGMLSRQMEFTSVGGISHLWFPRALGCFRRTGRAHCLRRHGELYCSRSVQDHSLGSQRSTRRRRRALEIVPGSSWKCLWTNRYTPHTKTD